MWQLNKRYKVREEDDGAGLMADTSTGSVYVLNPTAMFILSMFHRKSCSLEEIISQVCANFKGTDCEIIAKDIQNFITKAAEKEYLIFTV